MRMFAKRAIIAIAGTGLLAAVFVGCSVTVSGAPSGSPSVNPNVRELDFSYEILPENAWSNIDFVSLNSEEDGITSVSDVNKESFVLLDGGSGSCVENIDAILYDDVSETVTVSYEPLPEGTACTMDYVMRAYHIQLLDAYDSDNFSLLNDVKSFGIKRADSENKDLRNQGKVFADYFNSDSR